MAIPGDKSISHRVLMCAAIARGTTLISGLNRGDDVRSTIGVLRSLGVRIEEHPDGTHAVYGTCELLKPPLVLDCGNSGSTMRMTAGLVAGRTDVVLDGDASLRRRPMERVAAPLRAMGADVRTTDGRAPIEVRGAGKRLRGATIELPVASAQLKTAVLFAGLDAEGETSVIEPNASRDHTELMLDAMGAAIQRSDRRTTIRRSTLQAIDRYRVPGDISAAFFFIAGAAVTRGASIVLPGVGVNPTRTAAIDVVRAMGADIGFAKPLAQHGEPSTDITVRGARLSHAVSIESDLVPGLIDEVPALCAVAAAAGLELAVSGAAELRTKESDRIATTIELLAAFGARADASTDGLHVQPGIRLHASSHISTRGDHRIGMAAAILALAAGAPLRIDDADCIETSFPGFAETWSRAFA